MVDSIKFLYSYGGKILPRYPDGKLRYSGGDTRVLSVDRSISFTELILKLGELCGGSSVSLRCQLPTEDLDALISITSDEDLGNLIEEYDRAAAASKAAGSGSGSLKIRAFLSAPKSSMKQVSSPPPSTTSSVIDGSSDVSSMSTILPGKEAHHHHHHHHQYSPPHHHHHQHRQQVCVCQMKPKQQPVRFLEKSAGAKMSSYYGGGGGVGCVPHHGSPRHMYLVHNGNHWQ